MIVSCPKSKSKAALITLVFLLLLLNLKIFGCARRLVGFQLPDQGLNPGNGNKIPELQPLDHQGTSSTGLILHATVPCKACSWTNCPWA